MFSEYIRELDEDGFQFIIGILLVTAMAMLVLGVTMI